MSSNTCTTSVSNNCPPGGGGQLPFTGFDMGAPLVVGVILVAVGVGFRRVFRERLG